MTKSAPQDLSILAESKHGLLYLTANDWALIVDKAKRINFKAGDLLVQRGKPSNGIFLILKGNAKVQILQGKAPTIKPGEICGELSFLDELPASADVVAEEATEAYFIAGPTLNSTFELFPHLASRFYRSVAMNLSRRLREMIEMKSGPS